MRVNKAANRHIMRQIREKNQTPSVSLSGPRPMSTASSTLGTDWLSHALS